MNLPRIPLATLIALISLTGCEPQQRQPLDAKQVEKTGPQPPKTAMPVTLRELKPYSPGIHMQMVKREDGQQSSFTISIPQIDDQDKPAPLVIALHFGGAGLFYGRGVLQGLVAPALAELNPIVVAPDVIGRNWADPANEEFLFPLIDAIKREHNVDEGRILLTGFSMGGHGTFHLGLKHQDKFTAAIPIAARGARFEQPTSWSLPFYVIHSNADEVVKIEPTRKYCERLKEAGGDVTFVEVEGLEHGRTPDYQAPLRDAIPWLKRVWQDR